MRAFKALDGAHQFNLHIERQAGRDAVRVNLVRGQPLRLDENLVRSLVGKAHDLVFNGRTVARPHTFDRAGVHRRAVEATADDVVRALVGVRDVARHLARMIFDAPHEGKHRQRFVARLRREL